MKLMIMMIMVYMRDFFAMLYSEAVEDIVYNFDLRTDNLRIVDPVLSGVANGYRNIGFVGTELLPIVHVEKEKGKILTFGKENFVSRDTIRAVRGPSNRIPPTDIATTSYELVEHDTEEAVDMRELEEANSVIRYENRIVTELSDVLALGVEKEIADFMQEPTNFNNTATLLAAGSWISADDRDVINDFRVAREAIRADIGRWPNTCIMPADVYLELIHHQNIIDKVQYSGMARVTKDILASILDIENLHIGFGSYTTDSDAADALTDLWSGTCVIAYVDKSEQKSEYNPSLGYVLKKKGYPEVDIYYEVGGKIKVFRNTEMYDIKTVQIDCAYLYAGCLA